MWRNPQSRPFVHCQTTLPHSDTRCKQVVHLCQGSQERPKFSPAPLGLYFLLEFSPSIFALSLPAHLLLATALSAADLLVDPASSRVLGFIPAQSLADHDFLCLSLVIEGPLLAVSLRDVFHCACQAS